MDYFRIASTDGKESASFGDDIRLEGAPRVQFQVSTQNGSPVRVRAELIRMGEVIKIFEGKTPFKVDYSDRDSIPFRRIYYRLDVKVNKSEHIVTNPVFVHKLIGPIHPLFPQLIPVNPLLPVHIPQSVSQWYHRSPPLVLVFCNSSFILDRMNLIKATLSEKMIGIKTSLKI